MRQCHADEASEASRRVEQTASKSSSQGNIRKNLKDRRSWLPTYAKTGQIEGLTVSDLPEVCKTSYAEHLFRLDNLLKWADSSGESTLADIGNTG